MEGSMHPQSRQAESLGAMQDELLRLQDLLRRRQQQRSPPRQRSRSRQSTTPRPSPSAPSLTEPPSPLSPWDLLHDEEGPENERSLSPTPWPYQPPAPPPPPPPPPPTPPAAPPFVAGEPPRVVAPPPWMTHPTPTPTRCPPPEPAAAGRRGDGNSNSSQTVHVIEAMDVFMEGTKKAWGDLSKRATKAFEDLDKQRQVAVDDRDKALQERRKLEIRNAELEHRTTCVMCMQNERGVVFQPCCHLVSCTGCQNEVGICPVCRETIYGRWVVKLA